MMHTTLSISLRKAVAKAELSKFPFLPKACSSLYWLLAKAQIQNVQFFAWFLFQKASKIKITKMVIVMLAFQDTSQSVVLGWVRQTRPSLTCSTRLWPAVLNFKRRIFNNRVAIEWTTVHSLKRCLAMHLFVAYRSSDSTKSLNSSPHQCDTKVCTWQQRTNKNNKKCLHLIVLRFENIYIYKYMLCIASVISMYHVD